MQETSTHNPIITVVSDPEHKLGKQFDINPDGTISKKSAVNLSFGIAVQHHVPTHDDLAKLLSEVGNNPHAAIINASFNDIPVGEEFIILSEREIEERHGIPRSDRERQRGIHQIEYDGKTYKAVGRFKENVSPSNWQLLDRDVDSHTPAQYADLTIEEWLSKLALIIPGIDKTAYVETPSTSSRVLRDDKSVGGGNGHVWVYVQDPADIERARVALIVRAAQAEVTWLKPRYSRKEKDTVVGNSLTTLIDPSVWTPGRLVFEGQPTVGNGLTVEPMSAVVHEGACQVLDTSLMLLPDANTVREVTRKAGVGMDIKIGSNGIRITTNNLKLNTEIETKDHGILTVRKIIESGIKGKLRCQTPFRESSSYAAFYNINDAGIPFVYDSGTGTTHWMNDFEVDAAKLIRDTAAVDAAMPKIIEDSAAALDDDVVAHLAAIKQAKPSEYQRKRAALKQANKDVSLTAVDSAVKSWAAEMITAQTHHGYAKSLLVELTEDLWKPVGHHNSLFVVDPTSNLWVRLPVERLVRSVAEQHDGKEHCNRSSDYKAIAEHAVSLANDDKFFDAAPVGIACPGGF